MNENRGNSLIDRARAHDLAYSMWKIRLFEERIVQLYPQQEMRCPVHLSIGQEAVAAGVCLALQKEDMAMSGHRAHAHFIAKGGNISAMMAEIYGKRTGVSKGRGGSMHLIDLSANFLGSTPIVGGTIPVGVGTAWASHMQGLPHVTVIFFGEGATEEGVWHESMNFAALHKLPALFVCENNLYSVYTPLNERQPSRPLHGLAAAYGMHSETGDGNNAVEVFKTTSAALASIREGKGPVFLEFFTYRWREHCGPNYDNTIGYRSETEFLEWQNKDPLRLFKEYVTSNNLISETELEEIEEQVTQEIDFAVDFAKASPVPAPEEFNEDSAYA